jgi:voltage-gated potassium channel
MIKAVGALMSNRVIAGLLLLALVLAVATAGYMLIEGWSFLDAFYMSVTAVTTVGFSEVHPLSTDGRIFTLFVVLLGVGIAFYILTAMVAAIIEGDFRQVLDLRRLRLAVQDLEDHYIICGYGRVGEEVVRELSERKLPLVVVDSNEAAIERARAAGVLTVLGDATVEETLLEAGVMRCNTLFAASDSVNTYITLSAKGLHPETFVVARLRTPAVESKLRQAGADRVVSPYSMGGRRMAFAALQPFVTDFVDLFSNDPLGERVLAEVAVDAESEFAGRELGDVLGRTGEVVVLAVRDAEGRLIVGPPRSRVLQAGEIMIVIGAEDDVASIGVAGRPARTASHSVADRSPVLITLRRLFRRDGSH